MNFLFFNNSISKEKQMQGIDTGFLDLKHGPNWLHLIATIISCKVMNNILQSSNGRLKTKKANNKQSSKCPNYHPRCFNP